MSGISLLPELLRHADGAAKPLGDPMTSKDNRLIMTEDYLRRVYGFRPLMGVSDCSCSCVLGRRSIGIKHMCIGCVQCPPLPGGIAGDGQRLVLCAAHAGDANSL